MAIAKRVEVEILILDLKAVIDYNRHQVAILAKDYYDANIPYGSLVCYTDGS